MDTERRDTRRVLVGPDHTVRFLVHGQPFHRVHLSNLSPGGCFATVLGAEAKAFGRGTLLEQFTFEHPDLPHEPFTALVAYTLGSDLGEDLVLEYLGLGIQFLAPPVDIQLGVEQVVTKLLGSH